MPKCQTLRNRDSFGHPIKLNMNKSGETTFTTTYGGCLTLAVKVVISVFVVIKILLIRYNNSINFYSMHQQPSDFP